MNTEQTSKNIFMLFTWLEFGSAKNCMWLLIYTIAEQLHEETQRTLPFWYAFTACDKYLFLLEKE